MLYYTYYMATITTVRLPEELTKAMERLQARDGMPVSEQIRRALADFLTKKKVFKKEKR